MSKQVLERAIFAAYKQALVERELAVAEHLLEALETLCQDDELETGLLASAYLIAADPKLARRS